MLVLTGAIGAAGFAILTQLPATGHYSPLLAAVMLVGFGTAGTAFGTMVIATSGVDGAEQGVVGGVVNTSRQIGAATGAALLPAISAAVSHNSGVATATGTRAAMLAGAIAALLATIIAWRGGRGAARAGAAARPDAAAGRGRRRRGRGPCRQQWLARPSGGARHQGRPGRRLPRRLRLLAARRQPGRTGAAATATIRRAAGQAGTPSGPAPGCASGGSDLAGTTARWPRGAGAETSVGSLT